MKTIIITGGTGLIGKMLSKALLDKGYTVIIFTRNPENQKAEHPALRYISWDVEKQIIDAEAISQADYIIHLAGAGVADKRWSRKRKQEIVDSRVKSSELLIKAVRENKNRVKAVISSSATGWYGADRQGGSYFTESSLPSGDFLATTCKLWEESITPVEALGIRLVKLRTGIVLSNNGGAIPEFRRPLRFGFAAILGTGRQMVSWIHIDDLLNLFIYVIENEKINGIYNAVAPHPVTNKELMLSLAKATKNFFIPVHVPSFILKTVMGEMSTEVLKSATVSSKKIEDAGFSFQYPVIDQAIRKMAD